MREKELSTRVYFVRHGQTDFPLDRIYCDDLEDPVLNDNGLNQVSQMADFFKNKDISAIYASPMQRTKMTAAAINSICNVEIEESREWMERRFGIWEGLYFKEIEEDFPHEFKRWKEDNVGFTPEGGENIPSVQARLSRKLSSCIESHKGQSIIVVSHVGPIRVSICDALQIPIKNYRQIYIDYASITCVDFGRTRNNLIFSNFCHY